MNNCEKKLIYLKKCLYLVLFSLILLNPRHLIAGDSGHSLPPCSLSGTTPASYSFTYTYTLSTCTAINWFVSCGTIVSTTANSATITWTDPNCTSATITAVTSTTNVTKTVTIQNLALDGGSISNPSPPPINYSSIPAQISASAATGGGCGGVYTYQWFYSMDNSNWQTITGTNVQNYQPGLLTQTAYYKRQVSCSGVTLFTSNTATVTVNAPATGVGPATNVLGNLNSNMNWIISTGYDQSGNILGQEKQFYDNSARLLQTQKKINYRRDANGVFTHVFASQPVRDVYGREVLKSMSAPIDYADFNYVSNFVQATDGSNYSYKNFDRFNPSGTETDKTNTPDPVGGQATKGTLGWYFSANNTWEPYQPTTNYPYSRQSIYRDGTNSVKKNAEAGEAFIMGSNHENSGYVTPVNSELANYMAIRNQYFTTSQVGSLPVVLQNNAIQTVVKDANGNEVISITDLSGKQLMSARPGNDLTVSNAFSIINVPPSYVHQLYFTGTSISMASFSGGNNIIIYLVSTTGQITTFYSGLQSGIPLNSNIGTGTVFVLSDLAFAASWNNGAIVMSGGSAPDPGSSIPSQAYFKIFADNTPVNITGSYTLYDMNTETTTSLNSGKLNRGYYKVISNNGTVNVSYGNSFGDIAYNYYNQLGQLAASIAPNGVKLLLNNGFASYPTLASVPFATLYQYDSQGRLVATSNPDAGASQFILRKDGKIRFSQNALQISSGSYSYTNYDAFGRPIESGQYLPNLSTNGIAFNTSAMTNILEDVSPTGGLTDGIKTEVAVTIYDLPDNTHGISGYSQDNANLGSAISTTKKYSSITNNSPLIANLNAQTWYNYDEDGRLLWQIKYIATLGSSGYKTTDFTYDALGRLVKKIFQKNTSAETFVHYYTYDVANGNLLSVATNTVDNTGSATLQANYVYYLHGGLKRVEVGGNVQGIDYVYTLQGALKAINNSNNNSSTDPGNDGVGTTGFNSDAFGEVLDYYTNDYNNSRTTGVQNIYGVNNNSSTDSWVGNIKAMTWYSNKPSGGSSSPTTYLYTYDSKYQFTGSTWGNNMNFASNPATYSSTTVNQERIFLPNTTTPAYDLNGNILNLQRTDPLNNTTDLLAYSYAANTNRLSTIVNSGTFQAGTYSYGYDPIGRETSEATGNVATSNYFQYDVTGKVTLVARDASFSQPIAQFVYDEEGDRVEKISFNASNVPVQATYYYGDVIYTQTIAGGIPGALTVQEYQISGKERVGVYYKQTNSYSYELKDHIGNIRATISKAGTMQTATDFYPFGMVISTFGSGAYRYGYQGENAEMDGETGWNNFLLRMYYSRIARWMSRDPRNQFYSPYTGMGNDPVNGTDPDGGFFGRERAFIWSLLNGGGGNIRKVGDYWYAFGGYQGSKESFLERKYLVSGVILDFGFTKKWFGGGGRINVGKYFRLGAEGALLEGDASIDVAHTGGGVGLKFMTGSVEVQLKGVGSFEGGGTVVDVNAELKDAEFQAGIKVVQAEAVLKNPKNIIKNDYTMVDANTKEGIKYNQTHHSDVHNVSGNVSVSIEDDSKFTLGLKFSKGKLTIGYDTKNFDKVHHWYDF